MDCRLVFGWLLQTSTFETWLRKNDFLLDDDGLLPRTAKQRDEALRLFPTGIWLTYASMYSNAPISARHYAVTLLPPGCSRVTLKELMNFELSIVDIARTTVRSLGETNWIEDPEIYSFQLPKVYDN